MPPEPIIDVPDDATETEIRLHCKGGHRWREVWPAPMTLEAFANRMKRASTCPRCSETVFIGWPEEAK